MAGGRLFSFGPRRAPDITFAPSSVYCDTSYLILHFIEDPTDPRSQAAKLAMNTLLAKRPRLQVQSSLLAYQEVYWYLVRSWVGSKGCLNWSQLCQQHPDAADMCCAALDDFLAKAEHAMVELLGITTDVPRKAIAYMRDNEQDPMDAFHGALACLGGADGVLVSDQHFDKYRGINAFDVFQIRA